MLASPTFLKLKYSEMPADLHPGKRLRELGPKALSTTELLAIVGWLVDTDQARALTELYNQADGLGRIRRDQITAIHGLGERVADVLIAVFELGRRELYKEHGQRPTISSPGDAAALVQYEMSALEQEELRVILLNTRNQVVKIETVYRGSVHASQVRVSEIFKGAVRENDPGIIVVHNHPSGDPTPSPDDVAITRAFVSAGKLMDIEILDHLVVGQGRFVSMKERGLGFG